MCRSTKHPHTAPQASGYPASAPSPTIAVAALLELARWSRQRVQHQGVLSCTGTRPDRSPPATEPPEPTTDSAPTLGSTHHHPAATTRATRRALARPTLGDGRPSGGRS